MTETYTCKKGHTGLPYVGTDGFKRCRECKTEYRRKWELAHPEHQQKVNEYTSSWAKKYPERRRAQVKANYYRGNLIKGACENCGSTTKLEMHHPDYLKPTDVTTLCKPCHEARHHKSHEPPKTHTKSAHSDPKRKANT